MDKQELINKFRDINVDNDWWYDHVYEDFVESMTAYGIEVDRMFFNGFWSQGDGACFEGSVNDWGLFLDSCGYTEAEHSALHKLARQRRLYPFGWSFSVSHRGHYYHEECTYFHVDMPNPDYYGREEFIENYTPYDWKIDDIRTLAWYEILTGYDYDGLERDFTEYFKSHMRDLYRNLWAEYEYLVSDEAVWDAIEANELDTELEDAA